MDVGQALPRFGGFPHSKRRPARRRDVGSPKSAGGSTHDLTGVFVKPSKETMLFLCLFAAPVRHVNGVAAGCRQYRCGTAVDLNVLSFADRRLFFLCPLVPRGYRLSRTPHAGGALTFLRDQKSKQKSRRECDSPFPTPVGTENRTFPDQQPLPVLRLQGRSREYF